MFIFLPPALCVWYTDGGHAEEQGGGGEGGAAHHRQPYKVTEEDISCQKICTILGTGTVYSTYRYCISRKNMFCPLSL
jgi:hypothetical protein